MKSRKNNVLLLEMVIKVYEIIHGLEALKYNRYLEN